MRDNSAQYLASLIIKYQNENLTEDEQAELNQWISASEDNRMRFLEWLDETEMRDKLSVYQHIDIEENWQVLSRRLPQNDKRGRVVRIRGRWLTAASLLLILATGYWFLKQDNISPIAHEEKISVSDDVKAPDANRATITMADGSVVYLDSDVTGQLAMQNNVRVIKLANGEVRYEPSTVNGHLSSVAYNTLSNPKGSRVINITLSDGSKMWLNAGSSITYPVSFPGKERELNMTGEVYFQIAHDSRRPFVVGTNNLTIQVLGTHFNVKAYPDEQMVSTTLLEGSVRVDAGHQSTAIKPGQQARLQTRDNRLVTVDNVNIEEVMAWKNGLFQFNNSDIEMVMRELSRWYNVEVSYPAGVPNGTYWGSIRRDQNLSDVFKVLEESGAHFKIKGKQVIVLP